MNLNPLKTMPLPPITSGDRARLIAVARRLAHSEATLRRASRARGFAVESRIPEDLGRWLSPRLAGEADLAVVGWRLVDLMTLALDLAVGGVERGTLRSLRAQTITLLVTRSNCR